MPIQAIGVDRPGSFWAISESTMSKPSPSALSRSAFGPSQKDIANALGIAQTTVALALNPKYQDRFAASTVEMIMQKANEMGYRPKRFAQIMRGGRSRMIGILSQGEFHQINQARLGSIINKVLERGFTPIIASTGWFKGDIVKTIDYLRDQMVEGMIVANLGAVIQLPSSIDSLPKISFSELTLQPDLSIFDCDVGWAFRELTRHHLATGSRNLVLLMNQRHTTVNPSYPMLTPFGARVRAFTAAIQEAGGVVEDDSVGLDLAQLLELPPRPRRRRAGAIRGRIVAREWSWSNPIEVGREVAKELLGGASKDRPDSILGSNDEIALGVMRTAQQLGFRIPHDLRLSGYDDDVTSQYLTPSLTSAEVPLHEIVDEAMADLVEQIEHPGRPRQFIRRIYKPYLRIRESTLLSPA